MNAGVARTRCSVPGTMYIASSIKANVREIEGALIRLAVHASLSANADRGLRWLGRW